MKRKKLIQTIKCFFGKHEWEYDPESYDPEHTIRKCKHCSKIQKVYKGDWYDVK